MAKLIMAAQPDQIANIRLPGWRHMPGTTRAADRSPLDWAKDLVPLQFKDHVPLDHPAFGYALLLHDNHYFWEAHEVMEAIWLAAPKNGRDRIALKALIQITNAGLKAAQNKVLARNRLVDEALDLLHEMDIRRDAKQFRSPASELKSLELALALNNWLCDKKLISKIRLESFLPQLVHNFKDAK
jgi:Domain of unknown function (DUF309)